MGKILMLTLLQAGAFEPGAWERLGISMWFAMLTVASVLILSLSLLFGDHDGDMDHDFAHDMDHDMDHDLDGGGHMSPFSTKVVLMFTTGFGVGGFIGARYDLQWTGSILSGIGGGLILGAIGYLFLNYLYQSQSNSAVGTSSLVGMIGTVSTGIGASSAGRISLTLKSGLELHTARSTDGSVLTSGTPVRVVSIAGTTLMVESVSLTQPTLQQEGEPA
jgi:membrane protein implicated in regulation of membrane protease activity